MTAAENTIKNTQEMTPNDRVRTLVEGSRDIIDIQTETTPRLEVRAKANDETAGDGIFNDSGKDEIDDEQKKLSAPVGVVEGIVWTAYSALVNVFAFSVLKDVGVTAILAKTGLAATFGLTSLGAFGISLLALPLATYVGFRLLVSIAQRFGAVGENFKRGVTHAGKQVKEEVGKHYPRTGRVAASKK